MLEFKTNKPRIALLLNNQAEITFTCNKSVIRDFEALKDRELTVIVKEFREKRSLSQNAYLWVLLEQIAIKIGSTKVEVYQNIIKHYGLFEIVPIRNDAVETFKSKWGKNGLGWFCEDLGDSKLDGYTKLMVYYGSSTYDTKEMTRVLEAVVDTCKDLGISTMTLSEIMLLKNENDT